METPSSVRRVTRSQTLSSANNNIPISRKVEDSDTNGLSKSRQRNRKSQDVSGSASVAKIQDRSALTDITNDSPIVGLAAGNLKTPLSSIMKEGSKRPMMMMTPGSGEALLRGQVKTLLQKVEEEAEISKMSLDSCRVRIQGVVNSPMGLLAPTPANTPQVPNLSNDEILKTIVVSDPIFEEEQRISQVINDIFDGKNEENQITRSLLLDFSEKSDITDETSSDCTSVLTNQGMNNMKEKKKTFCSDEEESENASVWSIQVNASSTHDEDEEENYENEECEDEGEGIMEELCKGISRINVNEKGKAVEFAGKHTRFMYDSEDDELMIEEVSEESSSNGGVLLLSSSPSVVRLKGMPTPKGKHLRFPLEEEDDEEEGEQVDA